MLPNVVPRHQRVQCLSKLKDAPGHDDNAESAAVTCAQSDTEESPLSYHVSVSVSVSLFLLLHLPLLSLLPPCITSFLGAAVIVVVCACDTRFPLHPAPHIRSTKEESLKGPLSERIQEFASHCAGIDQEHMTLDCRSYTH